MAICQNGFHIWKNDYKSLITTWNIYQIISFDNFSVLFTILGGFVFIFVVPFHEHKVLLLIYKRKDNGVNVMETIIPLCNKRGNLLKLEVATRPSVSGLDSLWRDLGHPKQIKRITIYLAAILFIKTLVEQELLTLPEHLDTLGFLYGSCYSSFSFSVFLCVLCLSLFHFVGHSLVSLPI